MDLLVCCRRNHALERHFERPFQADGLYEVVENENVAKQKEFFIIIQNMDIKGIQCFVDDKGFEMKSAKEYPSEKEAFHFLAEIEDDALTAELEDDLRKIFDILIEAGCQINATDRFGNTPLMLAAEKGNISVVRLLLDKGADTEKTNNYKDGPLHWASKNGKLEATRILLGNKANINAQNNKFETPLHLAVVEDKKNVVRYLIHKGADPKLMDLKEKTPVQYAKSRSIEDLFEESSNPRKDRKKRSSSSRREDVVPDSESDNYKQEFDNLYGGIDLDTVDRSEAAKILSQNLKQKKHSMEAPPKDAVNKCRYFCRRFKKIGRKDIIKELRANIPAGMTGPLAYSNESLDTIMERSARQKLTRSLCGKERWRPLANELGIESSELDYYGRKDDPAEAILQDQADLTVGKLYDALVKSDAEGLADQYL